MQQLTEADRLPYVEHRDGWRLYRREQVEVVGNARRVRFGGSARGPLSAVDGA
ncbi:hypothetical protein BH18ACT8_BH18ACT8_09390 [soil metagenome]